MVRLRDGGLFVYAPVAPTEECLALVRELGDVRYIVLPTSAVEHKARAGSERPARPVAGLGSRRCAAPHTGVLRSLRAKVPRRKAVRGAGPVVVPAQPAAQARRCGACTRAPGSVQLRAAALARSLLGLFPRKLDGVLCDEGVVGEGPAPWAGELEQAVLATPLGLGPFVEAAFFVKATKTLLVTDIVVAVPRDPPEVCAADPQPLLVRAKPRSLAPDEDNTSESRQRGWWKTVLFALFFQPSAVDFSPLTGFTWNDGWRETFSRLAGPRLFVPPILQIIVLSKRPAAVRTWVSRVASWPFDKIIPAHLQARATHTRPPPVPCTDHPLAGRALHRRRSLRGRVSSVQRSPSWTGRSQTRRHPPARCCGCCREGAVTRRSRSTRRTAGCCAALTVCWWPRARSRRNNESARALTQAHQTAALLACVRFTPFYTNNFFTVLEPRHASERARCR